MAAGLIAGIFSLCMNRELLVDNSSVEIGVFGGSGFYKLFDKAEERVIETPYGAPSDKVVIGTLAGKRVAFLPRHGSSHQYPPHKVNFRANLWAMKSLGVSRIIGPCAAGSLQKHVEPGHFVVCDQFVDRTSGRTDTFYDGPIATHVSSADPYCGEMRKLAIQACKDSSITVHPQGTVVVIQGPRFSSKAESKWFTSMGWEVINMTQYPEAQLARELEMCYVNVALITDYDSGLVGDVEPVSHAEVVKVFEGNLAKLQTMLVKLIEQIPAKRNGCACGKALVGARFG
ncbi:MAG: S-methyl-5'-thioadenosine phosphorylase [Candidatus Obscuribacterales bacterium]|nr:S-methyl-5'-thioadenosine phosphorylase [Candidatus Obscuribacterales bacterium]